jgi:hypothetical protein
MPKIPLSSTNMTSPIFITWSDFFCLGREKALCPFHPYICFTLRTKHVEEMKDDRLQKKDDLSVVLDSSCRINVHVL